MLEVNGLSVVYPDGTKAVDALSFSARDGESIALVGANGAGKTSLLLSLVGIIPSGGEILLDGMRLEKKTQAQFRRRIGMVFQNPDDQLFMPSIYEDVLFGPRNFGFADAEARAERILDALDIAHLKHKSPLKLSGGEKRVAALAAVLVSEPSVILFDEPTAFLDPRARRNLIRLLGAVSGTKLIATHDLSFAAEVCTRAILLKGGRLFADGAPCGLLNDEDLMHSSGLEAIGYHPTDRR